MKKILGIDLAGKDINPTGICTIVNNKVKCWILYSDEEILGVIDEFKPDIVAIDAPIMNGEPRVRKADRLLKKYGAFSPSLPSMRFLTMRGYKLVAHPKTSCKIIEVFPTATAKILNIYNKDYHETAKKLGVKVRNKHELDAYLCALTAKLFLERKTVEIGDEKGKIVVPKINPTFFNLNFYVTNNKP